MKIYTDKFPDLSNCTTEDLISISEFHKVILNYLKMNKIMKTKNARNIKKGDRIEMRTMDGIRKLAVKKVKIISEYQQDLLITFENGITFHCLPDEVVEIF
jgi:uncharacterized protein Veg